MACTLTESPSDPFHRKLRQLRCLRRRFDCYRVERTSSRAGVAPAEVQRLSTAHFFVNYLIMGSALAYIQQMRTNPTGLDPAVSPKTRGFTAIGMFLFFGAVMASLAATTLLWQGTALDRVWA